MEQQILQIHLINEGDGIVAYFSPMMNTSQLKAAIKKSLRIEEETSNVDKRYEQPISELMRQDTQVLSRLGDLNDNGWELQNFQIVRDERHEVMQVAIFSRYRDVFADSGAEIICQECGVTNLYSATSCAACNKLL